MLHPPEELSTAAEFDLQAIAAQVTDGDVYARTGHAAQTLIRTPDLRVVVVAVAAGHRIPEHQASTTASVQVLSGQIDVEVGERRHRLGAGRLLVLESGARHDVEAAADSVLVLTLGWPSRSDKDHGS